MDWLRQGSDRSVEFTENRLRYGVALAANIKYAYPNWRAKLRKAENAILDTVQRYSDVPIKRIHDVGCGVGFFLRTARDRGMMVTGNDLNAYACQIMSDRYGLTVYNDILPVLNIQESSLDAVIMHDYIEHAYHPLTDLKAARLFLRPKGTLIVETFHTDCHAFDKYAANWNMLFWNHTFHFSTATLTKMIRDARFDIADIRGGYADINIRVIAQKN
jgi:2-polyprenyl-3-methyl-5-hydroxy-6-metoxy-1,4-benzoquinol methylase